MFDDVFFNRPLPCSDLSYLSALLYIRPRLFFFFFFFGCVLVLITVVLLVMQKKGQKKKKIILLLKDSEASIQRRVL